MNAELIDLYRGVQKYRGEWREDDIALFKGVKVRVDAVYDGDDDGDIEISASYDNTGTFSEIATVFKDDPDLLWLPPVWSEDERCLWKMVDWGKWSMWIGEGGLVSIHKWTAIIEDGYLCWDKPLPEALLRAIALRGDKS